MPCSWQDRTRCKSAVMPRSSMLKWPLGWRLGGLDTSLVATRNALFRFHFPPISFRHCAMQKIILETFELSWIYCPIPSNKSSIPHKSQAGSRLACEQQYRRYNSVERVSFPAPPENYRLEDAIMASKPSIYTNIYSPLLFSPNIMYVNEDLREN